MKNKAIIWTILIVGVLVVAAILQSTSSGGDSAERIDPTQTDFLGQPIESEETVIVKSNPNQPQKVETVDLENCLSGLTVNKTDSFSKILENVRAKTSARGEVLESTEYQLEGQQNEEIVIQHNLSEQPSDQVRVFKTASDGFPDRIKDYPQSSGTVEQRIAGALTLGTLKKKIEKYNASSISRGELRFEKENGEIVRINFEDGRKQLICEKPGGAADESHSEALGEDQNCSCQSF